MKVITIRLHEKDLERIKKVVKEYGFKDRTEFIRYAIKKTLKEFLR